MLWLITLLINLNVITSADQYEPAREAEYIETYAPGYTGPGDIDLDSF
jgi:hypothetical protein